MTAEKHVEVLEPFGLVESDSVTATFCGLDVLMARVRKTKDVKNDTWKTDFMDG